jgi:hypothetical protein
MTPRRNPEGSMRSIFYSVVVAGEVSRIFSTKQAALKWARWCTRYARGDVRVLKGGPGGMPIADLPAQVKP